MLQHSKNRELTKMMHKLKVFLDPRSFVSFDGHVYIRGRDRSAIREQVEREAKGICAICHKPCPEWDADIDHIRGGYGSQRCDCYHTILTDGTVHTNLQWVHSMWSKSNCHRVKHHRESEAK